MKSKQSLIACFSLYIFIVKTLDILLSCEYNISCFRKQLADMAQEVERILGKDEVTGSTPVISSKSGNPVIA